MERRLWHTTPKEVKRVRYFDPITLGVSALVAGGVGLSSLFNKKKDLSVPDPLAGLRTQLQALAGQVPAQVAKQKELTAGRVAEAQKTGLEGIGEETRATSGFGASSIQARLNAELLEKLTKAQAEADLASDIWGTQQQASILGGTAGMYPGQTQLEEEPSWQSNLLGQGANLAVQNYMDENKWKNIAKALGGKGGLVDPEDIGSQLGYRFSGNRPYAGSIMKL